MSPSSATSKKVTLLDLQAQKDRSKKIVALTAFDYPTAQVCETAGVDLVLVGDSLGATALGYENTLPVTLDEILAALRAVRRGVTHPFLVADLPFGAYHAGEDDALRSAVRLIKAGAEAVKLEGGALRAQLVRRLVDNDMPVIGHIGLTPQAIHALGGYRVQGKTKAAAASLVADALALESAGASAIVLEAIPATLGAEITSQLSVPTIGIGAGEDCDGQILVVSDLLGLLPGRKPKFVRPYLDFHTLAVNAVRAYHEDIRSGSFPGPAESYSDAAPRPANVEKHSGLAQETVPGESGSQVVAGSQVAAGNPEAAARSRTHSKEPSAS